MPHSKNLSSIEEIINDARNGRMFILIDDEDRENEGDLVVPAQMATPDAVNFMAKYGRGLICLALTSRRVEELELPLMARKNASRHDTAFTVSIEAREGVSTGISASDRARTIAVAIDPTIDKGDIVSPGHVFPLAAREGGVLVRAGHTEAAVDIARLAGLNPSGVICEIMNDDGAMSRTPELIEFAKTHGIRIATISDLIAYRLRHDRIVERVMETTFDSLYGGEFQMFVYINRIAYAEHVALVKGDISSCGGPVPVRMHSLNVLEDVLGDKSAGREEELHQAMRMIGDLGRGIAVLIREPYRSGLSDRVRSKLDDGGKRPEQLRDYGVGAQILLDLGISEMILLSNTKHTIIGLEGYGLTVTEQRPIKGPLNV
ncbi:MAG: 3,4-dihydroxy-2-butanone-4-phosphate synthase [Rhodospirillales bacterium RIFCSPLOWO2_12_FULL_58_28]|nr:MAG: 3,4-dihydroxy-2-butanone-4-phosphate synthase [Rhodospirillales bacterium RIFCSPLOWO2_02_FULL_58_16]OHC79043.1 MAG: 3,4-dihydroxy-2-butanone-4-phosphate synthase [Rhodospirillales bacterium RIFCSPLOWO2_12_FULL_58_28]